MPFPAKMRFRWIAWSVVAAVLAITTALVFLRRETPTRIRSGASGVTVVDLELTSVDGLSGLTIDDRGVLWAVPERDRMLLELDGPRVSRLVPLEGVDPRLDTESIAWIRPGLFAFGTEAAHDSLSEHRILFAAVVDGRAKVVSELSVDLAVAGLPAQENQGIEGICFANGTLVVALETPLEKERRRFAAIASRRWPEDDSFRVRWLALTTSRGKISGLDCSWEDGSLVVHAIERHYETMRILRFALDDGGAATIEPTVVRDLAALVHGTPNPEGLVVREDVAFVVLDNHYGRRRSPNELLRIPLR